MLQFSTEAVSPHITRIYAFATELMYLVEGRTQNILIDTGSGYGSLKRPWIIFYVSTAIQPL